MAFGTPYTNYVYQTTTTNGTSLRTFPAGTYVLQGAPAPAAPRIIAPEPDRSIDDPLSWLSGRVNEICELAGVS